jgi:hypothetical protein
MEYTFIAEPHCLRYRVFIESRPKRDLKKEPGFNIHHILPRSLGGGNEPANLIKLTVREHYIVHMILWKGAGPAMAFAFRRLIRSKKLAFGLTSRQHTRLKEACSIRTPEHRRRISESLKGHAVSEETRKRQSAAQLGSKKSDETKAKHRARMARRPAGWCTPEIRVRISESQAGKVFSEETRLRMSEAHKGRPNKALSRPVRCITTDQEFESASAASRETGILAISRACNGLQRYAGKDSSGTPLQWVWKEEPK